MKRDTRRFILFLTVLGCFMVWLGILIFYLPGIASDPDAVDVCTSFGMGGVTVFFTMLLKDAWQFYWRKSGKEPKGNV